MLVPENRRYNASEVLAHSWFRIMNDNNKIFTNLNFFNISFLKSYKKTNTFKKVILTYIASRINENEINDLSKLFEMFDFDHDGQISFEEFQNALLNVKSNGIKENEIKEIFNSLDTDKNGKIDYTEFIASCLEKKIYLNKDRLHEAFSVFDKDNDGVMTKEDIMTVLQLKNDDNKELDKIIKNIDKNGDGVIDKNEFEEFMNK